MERPIPTDPLPEYLLAWIEYQCDAATADHTGTPLIRLPVPLVRGLLAEVRLKRVTSAARLVAQEDEAHQGMRWVPGDADTLAAKVVTDAYGVYLRGSDLPPASPELTLLVAKALGRARPRWRAALQLRYGKTPGVLKTYREVGAELGVTANTARESVLNAQRVLFRENGLRTWLAPYLSTWPMRNVEPLTEEELFLGDA